MEFVCPICKGPLLAKSDAYCCDPCRRRYPVVLGIPDFRIHPDPYISIEDDWRKGERLYQAARTINFAGLLDFYYSITPEVPPDRAARWTARALAQTEISRFLLSSAGLSPGGPLLDVGCATAGLLAAAAGSYRPMVGVDVAFRWLVVGRQRLIERGIDAALVCANAEALPFAGGSFDAVTLLDVVEHTRDPVETISEVRRVLSARGRVLCTTNNRYAPVTDPHTGVWGLGYLPRKWQAPYVAWRRGGMHRFRIQTRSARELGRAFRQAGFRTCRTAAAPLCAPHLCSVPLQALLAAYNRARRVSIFNAPLTIMAPELSVVARK